MSKNVKYLGDKILIWKTINEQIKQVNLRFHPEGKFISGGVLDKKTYINSKVKMMILLKEVNYQNSKHGWSLPSFLEDNIYNGHRHSYRLWKNGKSLDFGNKKFDIWTN